MKTIAQLREAFDIAYAEFMAYTAQRRISHPWVPDDGTEALLRAEVFWARTNLRQAQLAG
jgi:hypothetical protein